MTDLAVPASVELATLREGVSQTFNSGMLCD